MPIQVIPRRNNNTAITQPSTNAVLIQWLACPRLIQTPPKNKQCKENRRNSIFLEKKNFQVGFYCQSLYSALIWVHRVFTVFFSSPSHLMPPLAPIQTGTVRSSFSSFVTVMLSLLLCLSCFFL